MTRKEQFCCELDTEFVRNFPDKYFDESYITSKDTVAFVGFINTVVERWCDILEKYAHYDTEYLASILKLDSSKAYCIFGAEIDERSRKVGREYLDIVRHLIEAIYVSGEMLKGELKRTMPDVRTALHVMNYQVQYPVTVTETDLRKVFLSMDGVQDLITRILIEAIYVSGEMLKAEDFDDGVTLYNIHRKNA